MEIYAENFDSSSFDEWSKEFSQMNDSLEVRKAGGAGFFCRVEDYKWIGGNDDLFRPASWEDKDLFIRMQLEGYKFRMIPNQFYGISCLVEVTSEMKQKINFI